MTVQYLDLAYLAKCTVQTLLDDNDQNKFRASYFVDDRAAAKLSAKNLRP